MIVILGAMEEEIAGFLDVLDISEERTLFHGRSHAYYLGSLEGKLVLLSKSGVGKVNAAMVASSLLERYSGEITHFLFTGVAGALLTSLDIGDLVVAEDTLQHDFDATPLNAMGLHVRRGQQPFTNIAEINCDPSLVAIAKGYQHQDSHKVHSGRILSGDQFLDGTLRRKLGYFDHLDGLAIEMEGAAVSFVCMHYDIPHLVIRTISDRADDSGVEDFSSFINSVAVNNSVQMVRHILSSL